MLTRRGASVQEWILIATSASNGEAEVGGVYQYHAVWVLRILSRQQRQHLQRGVPRPGGLQRARVPRGAELRDCAAGQDQALPHLPQLGPDVPLPLGIRQPRGGQVGRPRSLNRTEVSTGCPPILLQVCFLLFCQPKLIQNAKVRLFYFFGKFSR